MNIKLKNAPMQVKILGGFSLVCLSFLAAIFMTNIQTKKTTELAIAVENRVYPDLANLLQIQVDIVQIQQWLTDISATRGAKGFDDGYAEAEKYYKDALQRIDSAQNDYQSRGDMATANNLRRMKVGLDDYYSTGRRLAEAYVAGGPDAGNKLMDTFDRSAEVLGNIVEGMITKNEAELVDHMKRVALGGQQSSKVLILSSVVALFFAGLISFFLARAITHPIANLISYAQKITKGDLTAKPSLEQQDEIGQLSVSLNNMGDNLRAMFQKIATVTETLAGASTGLATVSAEMSNNVEKTTAKANTVAVAAEEMSVNMSSVAAATEETSVNVNLVATAADAMSSTIAEISLNTEKTMRITKTAVSQSANATAQIKELGAAALEIGKVTETITEISEQTNLLALNATIEAARAGDAGKGFAVVANEIKDLAKQTSEATGLIKNKIDAIQNASKGSVAEISQVSGVIDEIDAKISIVAQTLEGQSNATEEIAQNVAQASQGIQEVNENVAQASSVTEEIAADIAMVGQSSSEINGSSSLVRVNAADLEGLSLELSEIVAQFKV